MLAGVQVDGGDSTDRPFEQGKAAEGILRAGRGSAATLLSLLFVGRVREPAGGLRIHLPSGRNRGRRASSTVSHPGADRLARLAKAIQLLPGNDESCGTP